MLYLFSHLKLFLAAMLLICCSVSGSPLSEESEFEEELFEIESSMPNLLEDPLTFELAAEHATLQPGRGSWLAIKVKHEPHWHSYWKNSGESGMPLQVTWTLPEGFAVSDLQWPYPLRLEQNGLIGYGYEDEMTLLAYLDVPSDAAIKPATIAADIRWLVCSDRLCLPGESSVQLELPLQTAPSEANSQHSALFDSAHGALPKKTWQMQAYRHDGMLELHIQSPDLKPKLFSEALFFPEEAGVVDDKTAADLVVNEALPQSSVVVLKNGKQPSTRLKGVVVLQEAENANKHALEVDLPIHAPKDENVLAVRDPSLVLKKDGQSVSHDQQTSGSLILGGSEEMVYEGGLPLALLFAFVGGLLLNLMPCVMPVISLKVLSFVKLAGQSRVAILKQGIAFALGIIVSFWVLAGFMIAMQSYGHAVGWGFQLQEPLFVAILAAVLFVFALNMFGLFEFGTSLTALAGRAQHDLQKQSTLLVGSFFSGVLTTAVATPCTGPFLGSAIGFAATLSAPWVILLFTVLGAGMASPYLILAAFPQLLRFLPKPGAWMVTFKELVGFFMMATVLWLVWVFAAETGSMAVIILLAGLFLLAIASWVYGRYCPPTKSRTMRIVAGMFTLVFISMASFVIVTATSPLFAEEPPTIVATEGSGWEPFSAERVAELQAAGIPVFVDFTAKWCLICQANHLVVSTQEVANKMDERKVVKMKADWTRSDPAITAALRQFGRNGVPLYLLYGTDGSAQPTILPQVLTPDLIIAALDDM